MRRPPGCLLLDLLHGAWPRAAGGGPAGCAWTFTAYTRSRPAGGKAPRGPRRPHVLRVCKGAHERFVAETGPLLRSCACDRSNKMQAGAEEEGVVHHPSRPLEIEPEPEPETEAELGTGPEPQVLKVEVTQGEVEPADVPRLATEFDCIINSANNHLLSPGCTGIAGALVATGGPALMVESDAAKVRCGGEIAVGRAVATSGGALPCGVVHAVGMAYANGAQVKATPATVRAAFASGLHAAAQAGHGTAATKLMCARPGYSTVEPQSKAAEVMLEAMLRGAADARECGLNKVVIHVPLSYASLKASNFHLVAGDIDIGRLLVTEEGVPPPDTALSHAPDEDSADLSLMVVSDDERTDEDAGGAATPRSDVSEGVPASREVTAVRCREDARWIPDHEASACMRCPEYDRETTFSFWSGSRRHHCRLCGWVVCLACAPNEQTMELERWLTVEGLVTAAGVHSLLPQRVCRTCFRQAGTNVTEPDLGLVEDTGAPAGRDVPINDPGHWDVMISYTQRHSGAKLLASEVYSALRERGRTTWLDVKMAKLNEAAMQEAAQNSRCIVAVITGVERPGDPAENAYFQREYCVKELRWARAAGVPIQPVMLPEDKKRIGEFLGQAPADLKGLGAVDFIHLDRSRAAYWETGIDELLLGMGDLIAERARKTTGSPVSDTLTPPKQWHAGDWVLLEKGAQLLIFSGTTRIALSQGQGPDMKEIELDFPFQSIGASWRPDVLPPDETFASDVQESFSSSNELKIGGTVTWGERMHAKQCWNITRLGPSESCPTGEISITSVVIDELRHEWHKARRQDDSILFGHKMKCVGEQERGIVLKTTADRFVVGVDTPTEKLLGYRIQLLLGRAKESLMQFTDERGNLHVTTLFETPARPTAARLACTDAGWLLAEATTEDPLVDTQDVYPLLAKHHADFSLYMKSRKPAEKSDQQWSAEMETTFPYGPWNSPDTMSEIASFCQMANHASNDAQLPEEVNYEFDNVCQAFDVPRKMLPNSQRLSEDVKTKSQRQIFLMMTHAVSQVEVAFFADQGGGRTVRFRHPDDVDAWVHEFETPRARRSKGMPSSATFKVLRACAASNKQAPRFVRGVERATAERLRGSIESAFLGTPEPTSTTARRIPVRPVQAPKLQRLPLDQTFLWRNGLQQFDWSIYSSVDGSLQVRSNHYDSIGKVVKLGVDGNVRFCGKLLKANGHADSPPLTPTTSVTPDSLYMTPVTPDSSHSQLVRAQSTPGLLLELKDGGTSPPAEDTLVGQHLGTTTVGSRLRRISSFEITCPKVPNHFHIFLSYRRVDVDLAQRVQVGLMAKGYSVFMDFTKHDGADAAYFASQTLEHLRHVPVVVALCTATQRDGQTEFLRIKSKNDSVRREIRAALHMKKLLISLFPSSAPGVPTFDVSFLQAGLPSDVAGMGQQAVIELSTTDFDASIEKLHEYIGKQGATGALQRLLGFAGELPMEPSA
jgi:O-acetyl-ADP-ribose deacetylase (regulator of RNase III)